MTVYTSINMGRMCQPLLWLSILIGGISAQTPYNPTRVFRNGSLVYVFQPSPDSTQFELGTVDISSKIATSSIPYTTLYPTLPFLDSKTSRPFDAILDNGGNITVYTGDCAMGASGGQTWNFAPDFSEKNGNGSWSHQGTIYTQNDERVEDMGPHYLSAGIAFSTVVQGDAMSTDAYFFGGMCPFRDANTTEWQSAANYFNLMVTLEPSKASAQSIDYHLGISSSRGPPITEAGFSLTGLLSTVSNRSDGTQIQQQNFVLIGGHTNSAFINTSQVALFSLPQEGWTFVPVSQPDPSRSVPGIQTDITSIEPRSGHSAVLTPDGQRVIVFGGWIGDINTPADPQLAVLNVGEGYGGNGAWHWTVPTTSGLGLSTGSGLYGHGAEMLPGGVMMVIGGYSMATPNSRWRRASKANSQTLFFNITSNSWLSEYSPPSVSSPPSSQAGLLSTSAQKAGLGVGIGIGTAALIGLMGFYLWYIKKLKHQREIREKQLNELSLAANGYNGPDMDSHGGQPSYFDHSNYSYFYPTANHQQNQGWRGAASQDAERTGLLIEIPSPTRGLRRNRPNQPMSRYDERRVKGSGHIHPIDELDEDQDQDGANEKLLSTDQLEMMERPNQGNSIFDNAPVLDPFTNSHPSGENQTFTLHTAPASATWGLSSDSHSSAPEQKSAATHRLPLQHSSGVSGKVSPTKSSERTGSNLSERSTRSDLTFHSTDKSITRSASMRSAAMLNTTTHINPFKTPDTSPTTDVKQDHNEWQTSVDPRTHSLTSVRSNGRPNTANADAESYITAHSSFKALQTEGEALLGGNPERARPKTSSTFDDSNEHYTHETEGSTSRIGTTAATSLTENLARTAFGKDRRKSWLGSMRRALSRSATAEDSTRSLTTMHFESYKDEPSPVKDSSSADMRQSLPPSGSPRRAASDASFWRSRRGQQDWLDEEEDSSDPRTKWRRNSGDDWGAPEDLALAEKDRIRREWRERGNLLINITDDDQLPTPRTPINAGELGVPFGSDRPCTPADEDDWDVEAAVERRVVQVMFTVPKSRLRVVNADVDRNSVGSAGQENANDNTEASDSRNNGTPSRVKGLAEKFEQLSTHRTSSRPSPSPSPSIKSLKVRGKTSLASLGSPRKSSAHSTSGRE